MPAVLALLFAVPFAELTAAVPRFPVPPVTIDVSTVQPLTEPRVAVHPGKPDHVLIGAILAPVGDEDPWDCVVLATRNGGDSWTTTRLGIDRCIDPWLLFTSESDVLFAGVGIADAGEGDDRLRLWLARSVDAGLTWSEAREIGRNYEHPIVIADRNAAGGALIVSRRGRVTESGTSRYSLEFARVSGDSLDYEIVDEVTPSFPRLIPTSLLQSPEDRVYVTYNAHDQAATRHSQAFGFLPGADQPHRRIANDCAGPETDRPVFQGYPFAAAGAGYMYHVCIAADHRGVLFSRSRDGASWSDPRRVDGADEGAFALTPMLAANDRGHVVVGWQDRRIDPDCQRFTITLSAKRGTEFTSPVALDDQPSCPANPANGRAGRSWPGGGDYSSIDVDSEGRFHVAWAATRPRTHGRYRLRYAVIEVR